MRAKVKVIVKSKFESKGQSYSKVKVIVKSKFESKIQCYRKVKLRTKVKVIERSKLKSKGQCYIARSKLEIIGRGYIKVKVGEQRSGL